MAGYLFDWIGTCNFQTIADCTMQELMLMVLDVAILTFASTLLAVFITLAIVKFLNRK